jgi:hypothetical protein
VGSSLLARKTKSLAGIPKRRPRVRPFTHSVDRYGVRAPTSDPTTVNSSDPASTTASTTPTPVVLSPLSQIESLIAQLHTLAGDDPGGNFGLPHIAQDLH